MKKKERTSVVKLKSADNYVGRPNKHETKLSGKLAPEKRFLCSRGPEKNYAL